MHVHNVHTRLIIRTHTRLIIRTYYSDLEARARSLQLEVDERACSKYVCVEDFQF